MNENQTVDRRITRTRLAIRDALVTLIKEKGFDSLTIKDIVERANINRSTFYLHYKDKFDLLDQTETEIIKELNLIFFRDNSLNIADLNTTDQLRQLLILALEYVKEHADLMHAFWGLQGNYSFIARIRSLVEQNLKLGDMLGLKVENFTVPQKYLISYIIHAHLGVLQAWFESGCFETPKEMADIFFRLSIDGPLRSTGLAIGNS